MSDLEVKGLHASYSNGRDVLNGVTFRLTASQVMLLHGKNGSGKSTLLRVLSGLLPAQSGTISWNAHVIKNPPLGGAIHPWVGLMLQSDNIFPSLTVMENIDLASTRLARGIDVNAIKDQTQSLFSMLQPLWKKRAGLLSGGERKLLALLMATLSDASLLLLDEPLAGLADDNAQTVGSYLKSRKERGAAIIIVEHSDTKLCDGLIDFPAELVGGNLSATAPVGVPSELAFREEGK